MSKIRLKQINNSPASTGAVPLYDGAANVWSNNDDGALLVSKGTTAQRPGTPTEGMVRYNTTTGCLEAYVEGSWRCTLTTTNQNVEGRLYELEFFYNGAANNHWMDYSDESLPSNEVPAVIPWDSSLVGITFTNKVVNGDADFKIYATAEADNPATTKTLKYTYSVSNVRTARKTNFAGAVTFAAGDKVAMFVADTGDTIQNPVVTLYLLVTTNNTAVSSSTASGYFSYP